MGWKWKQWQILFSWVPKSLWKVSAATKLKTVAPWKKNYDKPRQRMKKQRHYFSHKGPLVVRLVKAVVFPVVTYGCESWTINKAEHQRIDAFELWCWRRFLRVLWTARRSNQSILKKNQPWVFIGRTDAEAEAPILWSPDAKSWLIRKDPDAEKDWRQEEKGVAEDEMVGWHHQVNGREFEQAPGVSEGQGSLPCCIPRGHKESGTT